MKIIARKSTKIFDLSQMMKLLFQLNLNPQPRQYLPENIKLIFEINYLTALIVMQEWEVGVFWFTSGSQKYATGSAILGIRLNHWILSCCHRYEFMSAKFQSDGFAMSWEYERGKQHISFGIIILTFTVWNIKISKLKKKKKTNPLYLTRNCLAFSRSVKITVTWSSEERQHFWKFKQIYEKMNFRKKFKNIRDCPVILFRRY